MLQKLLKGRNYSRAKTVLESSISSFLSFGHVSGFWVVETVRNGGTLWRFGWNKCQLLLIRKIMTGWIWMHQSSLLYLLFPNGPFCGTFSSFLLIFHWNEFVVPKAYVFLLCSLNCVPLLYFWLSRDKKLN